MLTNRSKCWIIGCLFLGLFFCLAGVGILKWNQITTGCFYDTPPLKNIYISIDVSQSDELLRLLKEFADKNRFKYDVGVYTPNGEDFSMWMERKDLQVIARSPFDPGEFIIGFYNNDCIHPTVVSDISGLVDNLEGLISEIPNATISEEK